MEPRTSVPPDTYCARPECSLLVAPYCEHIRERGKVYHAHCYLLVLKTRSDRRREETQRPQAAQ